MLGSGGWLLFYRHYKIIILQNYDFMKLHKLRYCDVNEIKIL